MDCIEVERRDLLGDELGFVRAILSNDDCYVGVKKHIFQRTPENPEAEVIRKNTSDDQRKSFKNKKIKW